MNTKTNLILLVIAGLFLAALTSRSSTPVLMALPFVAYLAAGVLTAPGDPLLRAQRSLSRKRSEVGAPVEQEVLVVNEGPDVPRLVLREPALAKLHVTQGDLMLAKLRLTQGDLVQCVSLPAGQTAAIRYTFTGRRGRLAWEEAQVTVSDLFGLFETQRLLPAPAQVLVLPEQRPLHRLRVRPRHTIRTAGPNLSRLPGAGVDFFGVREYHAGDSLRWIHWKKSARQPRTFFSKEFEREEMADIGLLVDASLAANPARGSDSLLEYSLQAAAALAKTILRAGNRVSLLVLGERIVRVFPGSGKRQLARILDQLSACEPGEKVSFETVKYLPVRLFPSQSLIIVISPLRQRDFNALIRLRAEGYQVLLISPDPVAFAARADALVGLDGQESFAVRAARLERETLLRRVRQIGVQVVDWPVDQPLDAMLRSLRWAER